MATEPNPLGPDDLRAADAEASEWRASVAQGTKSLEGAPERMPCERCEQTAETLREAECLIRTALRRMEFTSGFVGGVFDGMHVRDWCMRARRWLTDDKAVP